MRRLARDASGVRPWLRNLTAPFQQGHPPVPPTGRAPGRQHLSSAGCNYLRFYGLCNLAGQPAIGSRCWSHALQRDGVTMNTGLYRLDWTRLAAFGGHFAMWPDKTAAGRRNYPKFVLVGLAVVVLAGFGGWMACSEDGEGAAESETVQLATAAEPPIEPCM